MLHGCTPTHYSMDPGPESTLQKKVAIFLYKTLTNLKRKYISGTEVDLAMILLSTVCGPKQQVRLRCWGLLGPETGPIKMCFLNLPLLTDKHKAKVVVVMCSDVRDSLVDVPTGGAFVGHHPRLPLLCIPGPCGVDGSHLVCGSPAGLHDGLGGVHCHCTDLSSDLHGCRHFQGGGHRYSRKPCLRHDKL